MFAASAPKSARMAMWKATKPKFAFQKSKTVLTILTTEIAISALTIIMFLLITRKFVCQNNRIVKTT